MTRRVGRIKGQRVFEESPGHIPGRMLIKLEDEVEEGKGELC